MRSDIICLNPSPRAAARPPPASSGVLLFPPRLHVALKTPVLTRESVRLSAGKCPRVARFGCLSAFQLLRSAPVQCTGGNTLWCFLGITHIHTHTHTRAHAHISTRCTHTHTYTHSHSCSANCMCVKVKQRAESGVFPCVCHRAGP